MLNLIVMASLVYRIRFEIGINKKTNINASKHESTENWNISILCTCYMDFLLRNNLAVTQKITYTMSGNWCVEGGKSNGMIKWRGACQDYYKPEREIGSV